MSYARFGSGGSDIYLFAHYAGFVQCCGCLLRPSLPDEESENLHSAVAVVEHLRLHVAAGHHVKEKLLDPAFYPDDDFVPYVRPVQSPSSLFAPMPLTASQDPKDPT